MNMLEMFGTVKIFSQAGQSDEKHFTIIDLFYMGKQYGQTGKFLDNFLNMLKNFRVGGKKLGMVR